MPRAFTLGSDIEDVLRQAEANAPEQENVRPQSEHGEPQCLRCCAERESRECQSTSALHDVVTRSHSAGAPVDLRTPEFRGLCSADSLRLLRDQSRRSVRRVSATQLSALLVRTAFRDFANSRMIVHDDAAPRVAARRRRPISQEVGVR